MEKYKKDNFIESAASALEECYKKELMEMYNKEIEKKKPKEYYADQVMDCLKLIKDSPESRRIIISAWNPNQLKEMCLACCHVIYNFDVDIETKELSCLLYQRSGDMGLGVPFNSKTSTKKHTELLILITPHIIDGDEFMTGVRKAAESPFMSYSDYDSIPGVSHKETVVKSAPPVRT